MKGAQGSILSNPSPRTSTSRTQAGTERPAQESVPLILTSEQDSGNHTELKAGNTESRICRPAVQVSRDETDQDVHLAAVPAPPLVEISGAGASFLLAGKFSSPMHPQFLRCQMQASSPQRLPSLTGPPGHSVCPLRPLQPFGIQELPEHDGKRKAGSHSRQLLSPGLEAAKGTPGRTVGSLCPLTGWGWGPEPPQAPGTQWDSTVSAAWKDLSHDCSVDNDGQSKP